MSTWKTPDFYAPAARTATRWGLSLALALGLGVSAASAQLEYCEDNGLVIFEVEDVAPAGGWVEETQHSGFAGTSYFRWNGGDLFNNPGSGKLTYTLDITTPGDYEMRIHNHHNDPDSTMENDCWTRMDGGTWVKTYSGQNGWNWRSRFEYSNGNKEDAHFNLTAGQHTFEISGRSQNFRIDRVHFFLSGDPTDINLPVSSQGNCNGPTAHPDANPTSVTAVFSDSSTAQFQTLSGTPITLPNTNMVGRHLALSDSSQLVLPGRVYNDQEALLRVRPGMPLGSWVGLVLRAENETDDFGTFGGTQSMVYVQRNAGNGQVRVNVHDGNTTVYFGSFFSLGELDPTFRSINMRISTVGDTVFCRLNGLDAIPGGYTGIADPAAGGYTSLRNSIAPTAPGVIGIDYCLVREAGDIPDLYFDGGGHLWMSALEDNLIIPPTWQPGTFVFQHEAFMLALPGFSSIVFPFLDYTDSGDDHFVIGVVASGLGLPSGSDNRFEYKGQSEGDYQP